MAMCKLGGDWQDAALVVTQAIVPDSRSAERPNRWRATTVVEGREFTAESRNGVPHELARVLIAAGIPDQPVCVVTIGYRGAMGYRSLQWLADHTMSEGKTQPVHLVRYQPPDFAFADGGRIAQNRGQSVSDVSE